jgi:DHA1 family multidrug resistance protein-like MFS transporter
MIIPVLPLFASSIGLGSSGVGLIVAMPAAAKLLLNLPVGHLVDTVGRKPPLIAGVLVDGVGCLLTASATGLGQMVPARLLVGAGSACGTTAGGAYTMDVVGRYPAHIGTLLGTANAIGTLGFAAGPMLGGWLADRGGAALPFVLIGGILIASA